MSYKVVPSSSSVLQDGWYLSSGSEEIPVLVNTFLPIAWIFLIEVITPIGCLISCLEPKVPDRIGIPVSMIHVGSNHGSHTIVNLGT